MTNNTSRPQTIIDIPDFPDTHWSTWDDPVHSTFLEYRPLYQHPGLSPLAKQTLLSRSWSLDLDSDIILDVMSRSWAEDILSRDDLDEDLMESTRSFQSVIDERDAYEKKYHALLDDRGGEISIDIEGNRLVNNSSEDVKKVLIEYLSERNALSEKVDTAIAALASQIVRSGYSLGVPSAIRIIAGDILEYMESSEDPDTFDVQTVKVFIERSETLFDSHWDSGQFLYYVKKSKTKWDDIDLYLLSLFAHPGVNYPMYVHDVLVYLHSIQGIVAHDDQQERDVAVSGDLISADQEKVITAFDSVIPELAHWWV